MSDGEKVVPERDDGPTRTVRPTYRRVRARPAARLGEDHAIEMTTLGRISETSLTRETAIEMTAGGLPSTFVPGRNLLFFTYAAAIAYRRGIRTLVGGMCETDYSGYPDCRDDALKALQVCLNLGMDERFVLHTPLMWLNKAATWQLASDLAGEALVAIVRKETHTCYEGDRSIYHEWGHGCGSCPACVLRRTGHDRFVGRAAE